jgi:hypothetical protein
MSTIYHSFSLLTDRTLESQKVFIPLVQNYEEKAAQAVQQILVQIHQQKLETYETKIKFETEFQGLAYFMYHWWLSTAVFFITNIMLVEVLLVSYLWNVLLSTFQGTSELLEVDEEMKDSQEESENENGTIYESTTPPLTSTSPSKDTDQVTESISEESGHELDFEEIQEIRGFTTSPGFQITSQTALGTGYAVPVTSYSAQRLKGNSSMQSSTLSTRDTVEQEHLISRTPSLLGDSDLELESVPSNTDHGDPPIQSESHTPDIDMSGLLETEEEIHL